MKRRISCDLSVKGIDKAIRELNEYKEWLETKSKEFLEALAEHGVKQATVYFGKAEYDGTNDVKVDFEIRGENTVAVVAKGHSVLFIEFGSGVVYPDDHPEAAKMGMIRGEYGYKLGKSEKGWRYSGEPGTHGEVIQSGRHAGEVHTYGNPANQCVYRSMRDIRHDFERIARRVFND